MKTWAERLAAAEKRGRFTDGDKKRAWEWPTCAVGEHRGHYREVQDSYGPSSKILRDLGGDFDWFVQVEDIAEAQATYDKIQRYFRRKGAKR